MVFSNELKYKDTALTVTNSAAGSVSQITLPTQGVGSTNRIGDRAKILKFELLGSHYNLGSANSDMIRFIMFQAKGRSSTPAVTDVLTSAASYAPYVYNAREQFDIIFDQLISVCPGSDSSLVPIKQGYAPLISDLKFVTGSNSVYNGETYIMLVSSLNATTASVMNVRTWFEDSN